MVATVKNQREQGADKWSIAAGGKLRLDGDLVINGVNVPRSASFTPAANGSNVCEVLIALKDSLGVAVAGVFALDVYLSDDPAGAGLTATTASGAVTAATSGGTELNAMVAKKAFRVLTKADGTYKLSITDSAKTAFVVCAQLPSFGKVNASAALVTGNYG